MQEALDAFPIVLVFVMLSNYYLQAFSVITGGMSLALLTNWSINLYLIQIDVDIGSSSVARGVIGLVLGYVTSIVVDLAIVIEVCILFIHLILRLYQFNSIICNSLDHKVRWCSFRKIQSNI